MGSLTHFADMRLVLLELNSIVTAFDFLEPVAPCLFAEMLRALNGSEPACFHLFD